MKFKVGDMVEMRHLKGTIIEIRKEDYLPYLVYFPELKDRIWANELSLNLVEKKSDGITVSDNGIAIGKIYVGKINLPERYIIKKDATILFWNDGTKTIVKKSKEDKYDKRIGFLTAYFQKNSGLSKNKANKYLDSLIEEK